MSYDSQSQSLFDSGIPSSGRMAHQWSQSSNSQPSSQPTVSRLSSLMAQKNHQMDRLHSRPSSESGKTSTSQSRITMKDFFSVKKQRPAADMGDRSAAVEVAKQCVTQVREATEGYKSILEEHSEIQKELLSTQTNSVFEELSNHCKIVATEVKLRDEVTLELSELRKTVAMREQELSMHKEQLEESRSRELKLQQASEEADKENLLLLQSKLSESVGETRKEAQELRQTTAQIQSIAESLRKTASGTAAYFTSFQLLLERFDDIVCKQQAHVHAEPLSVVNLAKTTTSQKNTTTRVPSTYNSPSSDSTDFDGEGDDDLFFGGNASSRCPPAATKPSPGVSKPTPSANVRSTRRLVSTQPALHRFTGTSNSSSDIFQLAICSSTSSDSEDDITPDSQLVRTKTPLQFVSSLKRSHGTSEEAPNLRLALDARRESGSRGNCGAQGQTYRAKPSPAVSRTTIAPPKQAVAPTRRSPPSTRTAKHARIRQSPTRTRSAATTPVTQKSHDQYEWTPDPAAELFDSLFKVGKDNHPKKRKTPSSATSICEEAATQPSKYLKSKSQRRMRR